MIRIKTSVTIARSKDEVFDFVLDFENAPAWQTGVVTSRKVTPGPVRVGTRFDEDVRIVLRQASAACVITGIVPGRSISFTGTSAPVDYQAEFMFEQANEGCRTTLVATAELKGLWKVFSPLFALDARGGAQKELARMKAALEGRHARAHAGPAV
jgi:hypothetical protein